MESEDLRIFLTDFGLTQASLARLLDVTPRAVMLWLSGQRAVPGPVQAYIRLFRAAPPSVRQIELQRLKETTPSMRDGIYAVQYQSQTPNGHGIGWGTMILDHGRAFGADPIGGKYDGDYIYDEATGMAKVRLKITFPPNTPAVFGPAYPFEWSVDITGDVDPRVDRGFVEFATTIGPKIQAQYQFLRELPQA